MTLRIDPNIAALTASALKTAAVGCRPGEHVRIEQLREGAIGIGISNGHVVRAERTIRLYEDRPGGFIR